jgi:stage II sporulation protein D
MLYKKFFAFSFALIIFASVSVAAKGFEYTMLPAEPLIRIGLLTNASTVSITTSDTSLVAFSPDEPSKFLGTTRVAVSARAYRPATVDAFHFELQNIEMQAEAAELTDDIRRSVGTTALASIDPTTNKWRIWIGGIFDSIEQAEDFRSQMAAKGIDDLVLVTEKKTVVSEDAAVLSQQIAVSGKSKVRSLIKPTSDVRISPTAAINPNLREVIVNGSADTAKFSSLRSVAFGSADERANPVKLNGKSYRGKIEVFVNSSGALTVVNVVPLEDYLLGVVPSELSLPQLEAQKAQAIAARTYAVANINGYSERGFDMLPTVSSQVYKGVSIETKMGTQAVRETRGMIATYQGKPIMAYYTSTCGGRTENSENIFDHAEPYLRGVECSLEGRAHFDPFMIKTLRHPAKLREDGNLELVRLMSLFAVNGFSLTTNQITDEWLEAEPTTGEISNWLNRVAVRFGKPFPNVTKDTAKPLELARVLSSFLYTPGVADTLMSDSDVAYQLSFDDASEIPAAQRVDIAMLMRDGYFKLHGDLTLKPNMPFSRAMMLRLISQIFAKKNWMPDLQTGETKPSSDGKLIIKSGRSERTLMVRPDVFLFRKFGDQFYQVKEAALVGGEKINYQLDDTGAVIYLEITPSAEPTVAEKMSPFTNWRTTLSASTVQARLSRYVRGIGTLYDVSVSKKGYSRRAIELEIIGSNGTKYLKGGSIRSALRLREQLFVIDKKYSGDRVSSYTFTGRGWGHGVGMCQYGAYGLAKMGVKAEDIIKHYYSGVDVTRAY